jgi:hypothetical protein
MPEKVALIGAGIMGQAIGQRLLECDHTLTVFDIDNVKVAELVARGAIASESPGAATGRSDYVILSLNHADIVKKAVFGDAGIAQAADATKLCRRLILRQLRKCRRSSRHDQEWHGSIVHCREECPVHCQASSQSWRVAMLLTLNERELS